MHDNNPVGLIIAGLLIAVLACGFFTSSVIETASNANGARVAEAQAREAQAVAVAAQARVDLETAAGERAILDAAAAAVAQGNQALAADRREAHGEPLWPYVLGGCFVGALAWDWYKTQLRGLVVAPPETPTPLADWIAE